MCIVNECDETVPLNTDDPHMMVMLDGAKAELLQMARQQVFMRFFYSGQDMHASTTLHRIFDRTVCCSLLSLTNWECNMDDFLRSCLSRCR
jgi:hypothetical protein